MVKVKNTMKEFKEFASRGNVVDMAVGVIIGGSFGKIITSLVNDILMPIISVLTGGIDFSSLFIAMNGKQYASVAAAAEAGVSTINYGVFISNVVDFLIIAFTIFIMLKQINKFKKATPVNEPIKAETKICPFCKSEIAIDATRCPNCTSNLNQEIDKLNS